MDLSAGSRIVGSHSPHTLYTPAKMPLSYDAEYIKNAEPVLAAITSAFKTPVHDALALRAGLTAILDPFTGGMPDVPGIETTVHKVKSADGHIFSLYHVAPNRVDGAPSGPVILHAHGGGLIHGDAREWAKVIAVSAQETGIPFFTVDYRLTPESKFPAAIDDVYAALTWIHEHAEEFGVDRTRIAVMGESAGGNLAAAVSLKARDLALDPPLAKQILVYPMLDDRNTVPDPEIEPFTTWSYENNITAATAYIGADKVGKDGVSPYAAPARATDFKGLPALYIDVGALDIFRDECIAYAGKAAAANVNVELHVYSGVPHMFEPGGLGTGVVERAAANRLVAMKSF